MRKYYVTISTGNFITAVYDDSPQGDAPPAGAMQISAQEAMTMARHPHGHDAFRYEAGVVVLDSTKDAEAQLDKNRRSKITQAREEALRRIKEQVPALDNMKMIQLMVELWPMLDTTQASTAMLKVKDIYVYATTKIAQARNATQAQLDAYDPTTDPNWP